MFANFLFRIQRFSTSKILSDSIQSFKQSLEIAKDIQIAEPPPPPKQQTALSTPNQLKQLMNKILKSPPKYEIFRQQLNSLDQTIQLMEMIDKNDKVQPSAKVLYINNLLTYSRKNWGRQIVKSRQIFLGQIVNVLENNTISIEVANNLFPALFQNISFSYQPDQFLSKSLNQFVQYAPTMNINSISNSIQSIGKITRRRVQINSNPQSSTQLEQLSIYNSAQISLTQLIPLIKLKIQTCDQLTPLGELLIGYQKMELCDEIGDVLLSKIKTLSKGDQFTLSHVKLLHTISKYEERVIVSSNDKIKELTLDLFPLFKNSMSKLSVHSLCLSLNAIYNLNRELLNSEIVIEAQKIYCEKNSSSNMIDFGMMAHVSFMFEIITPQFSQLISSNYELFCKQIDINVLTYLIENMGNMINQRLLEKKFINMFLISVKVQFLKQYINLDFKGWEQDQLKIFKDVSK